MTQAKKMLRIAKQAEKRLYSLFLEVHAETIAYLLERIELFAAQGEYAYPVEGLPYFTENDYLCLKKFFKEKGFRISSVSPFDFLVEWGEFRIDTSR